MPRSTCRTCRRRLCRRQHRAGARDAALIALGLLVVVTPPLWPVYLGWRWVRAERARRRAAELGRRGFAVVWR